MSQKQSGFPGSEAVVSEKAGFAPYNFLRSSVKEEGWSGGTEGQPALPLDKMSVWEPLRLFERALGAAREKAAGESSDQFVTSSGRETDSEAETGAMTSAPASGQDMPENVAGEDGTASEPPASETPGEPELQFSAEDVLEVRDLAYGEGYEEGMRDGAAKAAEAQEALKTDMLERLASSLQARTRQHQEGLDIIAASMSQILVEAIEKLLPVYLKKHGAEEILGVFQSCIGNVQNISRITVRVHADCSDEFERELVEIARSRDFDKLLSVERDESLAPGDIEIDWGTGGLEHRLGQMIGHLHEAVALIEANLPYKSIRAEVPAPEAVGSYAAGPEAAGPASLQQAEQPPEQNLEQVPGQSPEQSLQQSSEQSLDAPDESDKIGGSDQTHAHQTHVQANPSQDPLSAFTPPESTLTDPVSPESALPETDLSTTDSPRQADPEPQKETQNPDPPPIEAPQPAQESETIQETPPKKKALSDEF